MFVTITLLCALAQAPITGDGGVETNTTPAVDLGVTIDAGAPPPPPDAGVARPHATVDAKWGEGVAVKAGDFSLTVRGRVQARAETIVPTEGSTATRLNQLLVRRARLSFNAKYTDDWTLTVQLAFATLDMESDAPNVLRDAYITWSGLRDLNLRIGQTKVPFGHQRVISSGSQQMVDRALVIGELSLDRDVGLLARSDDLFGLGGRLSYALGVMGGDGRNRLGTNVGLLYVARVQYSPFGKFDDLVAGDLDRLEKPRLEVALSAARNVATVRQRSTFGTTFKNGTVTYDHLGADLMFKWRGFSLEAEALLRQGERDSLVGATSTEWSRSGWGYYVQAGFSPVNALEVSARWGQLRPFIGTDPSFHHQRELGVGFGWYPKKHDLKLQADVFWLPVGERFDVGSVLGRVQLQLAY